MIKYSAYFEGHRGAVTALAQAVKDNAFYSAGAEGLIVYWQLEKPNEGDVVIKLPGYISALVFDSFKNVLYATVNHKGLYVIDALTKRVLIFTDIPLTSFGKIVLTNDDIIISTNIGEVLVLEKKESRIKSRIIIQSLAAPSFKVIDNQLWMAVNNGIKTQLLQSLNSEGDLIKFNGKIIELDYWDRFLIVFSEREVYFLDRKQLSLTTAYKNNKAFNFYQVHVNKAVLLSISNTNELYRFKLTKKGLNFIDKTEFAYNGQINDILWIENYKFVITAGADSKIGVWQIN